MVNVLLELDEREDRTPEEEALAELLTLLVEDYEEKHYPLPRVSPGESLRALMEERGLKHKDIWPVIGNKGAATEVLNGRRSISKAQAKRLAEFFRVLGPGGRLLLALVNTPTELVSEVMHAGSQLVGEPFYWPTTRQLRRRVEAAGFRVEAQRRVFRVSGFLLPPVLTRAVRPTRARRRSAG